MLIAAVMATASSSPAAGRNGGLVLQFDDGWTSWATLIAPEIQKAGGVATGFVNNQNIKSGRITRADLLTLQDNYKWEIGTHTWHHMNASIYVRKNGLPQWTSQELVKSITELRNLGLNVRSLAFPFNAFTPEIAKAVQPVVESYRRNEPLAIANEISADKSIPGTNIDMAGYVPPELIKKWIDLAARNNSLLFLYGHRILPDSSFVTGTVVSVTATTLTAEAHITLPEGADFVLVPDITRRPVTPDYFHVLKVDGKNVEIDRPDLVINTKPGATFMIGQAYSSRLSDLTTLLEYASTRVNFYTLHDVAEGKHKAK